MEILPCSGGGWSYFIVIVLLCRNFIHFCVKSLNQTQEEANVMRPPSPNPWGRQGDDDAYNKLNENVLLRALYEQRMSELTMNEQILFGHQLPDMLIDCTFNGRSCSPR